jgi:hypothetical protein
MFVEVFGDGEDVFDGTAEAVEFPDAQGVAGSEVVPCGGQSGALGAASGHLLFEDATAAGFGEGVAL